LEGEEVLGWLRDAGWRCEERAEREMCAPGQLPARPASRARARAIGSPGSQPRPLRAAAAWSLAAQPAGTARRGASAVRVRPLRCRRGCQAQRPPAAGPPASWPPPDRAARPPGSAQELRAPRPAATSALAALRASPQRPGSSSLRPPTSPALEESSQSWQRKRSRSAWSRTWLTCALSSCPRSASA